ncbi:hypothetical protein BsWGS_01733 [Bradybaena similaris]
MQNTNSLGQFCANGIGSTTQHNTHTHRQTDRHTHTHTDRQTDSHARTHAHSHTHTYTLTHMCVCVCARDKANSYAGCQEPLSSRQNVPGLNMKHAMTLSKIILQGKLRLHEKKESAENPELFFS